MLRVLVDPPVVDQPDRDGIEVVELLAARFPADDEAGALEDPQVLHHAEARNPQLRLELGERAAVTLEEPIEKESTRRVRERTEHGIVVVWHVRIIRDLMVTCQAGANASR